MASRSTHPLDCRKHSSVLIDGKMTGAGAADMVWVDGDVLTAVHTGTGIFNLTFRHAYPVGTVPLSPGIVGTTTGLVAIFTAWDPAAKTATVKFSVGGVATDPAATDSVRFAFLVRNSNG